MIFSLEDVMRERLSLLSRIAKSPPNLRVSGGFSLHHGGFLLHHGGFHPLLHGGFSSPHRLGSAAVLLRCCSLTTTVTHTSLTTKPLFCNLPVNLTEILPYQRPNPHRSRSIASPSPFTPRSSTAPFTAPPRPPPEPPPPQDVTVMKELYVSVSSWDSVLTLLKLGLTIPLPLAVFLLRPPPKPPWNCRFLSLTRLCLVYGASMVALLSLLLRNQAQHRVALLLFVKSPHRDSGVVCILLCAFWHLIIGTEDDYVASTSCLGLSRYLSAIEYQGNWLNPENKNSRNVPFRSQKSSGLDFEKKTRVSLFVIAKDWKRKLPIVWLLDWRYWFVNVPVVSKRSMSCDCNVYVVVVEIMILGCGWEMSQHICFHSNCNVVFDFY